MQKEWIQKQTQLLALATETDNIKASVTDQKNRKMVLEQKKLRVEGDLEAQTKEIKELEKSMKELRLDMGRMHTAVGQRHQVVPAGQLEHDERDELEETGSVIEEQPPAVHPG